jgi:hypothetical protein
MLNAERLRELLAYDPETGEFTNRGRRGNTGRAGKAAGSRNSRGYVTVSIGGYNYLAHRLAWIYVTGTWPVAEIDHINGDGADNRFANLREATRGENARNRARQNNTSGFKGVVGRGTRWEAKIYYDGREIYLGTFATPEEAHAAYAKAALEHHGEFARMT